jgi:hypothetical protein
VSGRAIELRLGYCFIKGTAFQALVIDPGRPIRHFLDSLRGKPAVPRLRFRLPGYGLQGRPYDPDLYRHKLETGNVAASMFLLMPLGNSYHSE